MYDVPVVGDAFVPRGLRGVAVVLDEYVPTHLDAWLGRALLADVTPARVLVVRHAGDVRGRAPWRGRGRVAAVKDARPPERPLYGVVVEERETALVPLPDRDPALLVRELSRAEWRTFL